MQQVVKVQKIKEIKLRPNIAVHDLETKTRQIIKFLTKGNKVRVGVFFRGRENSHLQLGLNLINKLITETETVAKPDSKPSLKGQALSIVLSPKKQIK